MYMCIYVLCIYINIYVCIYIYIYIYNLKFSFSSTFLSSVFNRLKEKYYIINALGNPSLLNKRSEFANNCRLKRELLLKFMKDSKD